MCWLMASYKVTTALKLCFLKNVKYLQSNVQTDFFFFFFFFFAFTSYISGDHHF